jgi:hypothetical protein
MLIMEDLQGMDESTLNDFAGIGELSTFKTVSPQPKHSAPRPTISLTRNDCSSVVVPLVDSLSSLYYLRPSAQKATYLRQQHRFMVFQI